RRAQAPRGNAPGRATEQSHDRLLSGAGGRQHGSTDRRAVGFTNRELGRAAERPGYPGTTTSLPRTWPVASAASASPASSKGNERISGPTISPRSSIAANASSKAVVTVHMTL